MRLADKAIIVTGGSKGIGREAALLFAREGARVVVTGRGQAALDAVVAEAADAGLELRAIRGDVSLEEDCRRTVEATLAELGRIDVLFNNAGVLHAGTAWETSVEVFDHTIAVNVRGTWLMSQLTIPHMLERGSGAIINNCSVLGLKACPGATAYNTSKGAVAQLTRSMALELAGTGMRVNAICPGTIITPMVAEVFAAAPDPGRRRGATSCASTRSAGSAARPEIAKACLVLAEDGPGLHDRVDAVSDRRGVGAPSA